MKPQFIPVKIIISAKPRHFEDADVNGEPDTIYGDRMPLVRGGKWNPTIDFETGKVFDWPRGTYARIHYKVCDEGEYWLEDADGLRLKRKVGYVPEELISVGHNSGGDYIILKINSDGFIEGWERPTVDLSEWE